MALAFCPTAATPKVKLGNKTRFPHPSSACFCSPLLKTSVDLVSLACQCFKDQNTDVPTKGFSVLSSDVPWEKGSIWTTMAMYMFNLHIPLGIGGLSIVAYVLRKPELDPQTEVLSLLVIQILELSGTLLLLRATARPQSKLISLLNSHELTEERNWILASALGFGVLILLVYLTSLFLDGIFGAKAVNNPMLKEILLSGNVSKWACVLVYCFITPLLEETIYRRFLLTSLGSMMSWQKAVLLSSAVFSAAHFSGENSLQLLIIGCVLGCCYCWTGKLCSSIAIHSLYNAVTLIITSAF